MVGTKYTCMNCEGEFESHQDDRTALEQAERRYPEEMKMALPLVILCEDCHKQFLTWFESLSPERREQMRLAALQ